MTGKALPIEHIIERANKYPIKGDNSSESDIIEWIYQSLLELPENIVYETKDVILDVVGGKVKLPDDLYEIITVRDNVTDEHMDNISNKSGFKYGTYKAQNGYIFTSFDEGSILLSYSAMLSDERGYPLTPNVEEVVSMVVDYIIKEKLKASSLRGDSPIQLYQQFDREYSYRKSAAKAALSKMTPDKLSLFGKTMHRPYIDIRRPWEGTGR